MNALWRVFKILTCEGEGVEELVFAVDVAEELIEADADGGLFLLKLLLLLLVSDRLSWDDWPSRPQGLAIDDVGSGVLAHWVAWTGTCG